MPELADIAAANPDIDLITVDLFDRRTVSDLRLGGADREQTLVKLRRAQRLLRIEPDPECARVLLERGYDSAHAIAAVARARFTGELASALPGGREQARRVHASAAAVRSRAAHLAANVHSLAGSAHFRRMAVNHVSEEIGEYFQELSSYAEIFGTLDYCDCGECDSILGPAAYLVDLLRIIDLAITQANPGIPVGLRFSDRRPDIAELPLTCANTDGVVSYLEIVAGVLEKTVARELSVDPDEVYRSLATALYPFSLPLNLPLTRIRRYLAARGTTLLAVYQALAAGPGLAPEQTREILGLTTESMANLRPVPDGQLAAMVSANYGLTVTADDLQDLDHLERFCGQTGLLSTDAEALLTQGLSAREVFDTSGRYVVTGKGTLLTLTQDGDQVTGSYHPGDGSVAGVMRGRELRGTWRETAAGKLSQGGFTLNFAVDGGSFSGSWTTGLGGTGDRTSWTGARDSATPSTAGIIPHGMFINRGLGVRQYLAISEDDSDPEHPVARIDGQSLATLGRLSRFIRLRGSLGWSWGELDWALNTITPPVVDDHGNISSAAELDVPTLTELAKIRQLIGDHGIPYELATALWFDLKTTGCGDGPASHAPFDQIFNDPAVLASSPGRTVYRPVITAAPTSYPNPLYRDDPLDWQVGAESGSAATPGGAIVAAVPAAPADIQRIAAALFGAGAVVKLTVPALSAIYRHALLSQRLSLPSADYIGLFGLLGLAPPGSLPLTVDRDQALCVVAAAEWVAASGLTVAQIRYAVSGTADPSVAPPYDRDKLPGSVAAMARALAPALVTPATFQSPAVPPAQAAAIGQVLVNQGLVDPAGVVIGDHAPDLTVIVDYAPQTGGLSKTQQSDVLARLAAVRVQQRQLLASQLATLLGVPASTVDMLADGAAAWRRLAAPAAPFTATELFTAPSADVMAAGGPDRRLVATAFAGHHIPLAPDPLVTALTVSSWRLTATEKGATVSFRAVTADGATVTFFADSAVAGQPAVALFDIPAADVLKSGTLEPALVTTAFAGHGITLSGVTASTAAVPRAWTVTDSATGAIYWAAQPAGPGTEVTFSVPAGLGGTVPAAVAGLVELLARLVLVQGGLGLTPQETGAILAAPAAFGIPDDGKNLLSLTFPAIHEAALLAQLSTGFNDVNGALAGYLAARRPDMEALCAVTGWDPAAAGALSQALLNAVAPTSVAAISRLGRVFSIAEAVGLDVYSLLALNAARAMTAGEANWAPVTSLADGVLEALHGGTPAEAWPATALALQAPVDEERRDALVAVALWKLRAVYPDITSARSLSEYLLLDVQMAGRAQISPVKEALNAAQLYLQRCRLNLEREVVISSDDLPEAWWEWLLDFRVWQANREIFLYPENWLDPSLRRDRTALFADLQNALLQGAISPDSVQDVFQKYLDSLAEIAALEHIGSYRAQVHDEQRGPVDTLFVFGRTAAQPYKFYVATREHVADCAAKTGEIWSQWRQIDLTIAASQITPVYVFGKLFVLWVEITTKNEQDGSAQPTAKYPITQATIKLSYQKPSGEWIAPQTVLADQVVDVGSAELYGKSFAPLFDTAGAAWWTQVGAMRVPGSGPQREERLCVYYGPLFDRSLPDNGGPGQPNGPQPRAAEFAGTLAQAYFVFEQLRAFNADGKVPVQPPIVLDANLDRVSVTFDNQYVVLGNNQEADLTAPTFRPELVGSAAVVAVDHDTVSSQYLAGTSVTAPSLLPPGAPLDAGSFVSYLVSRQSSARILASLSAPDINLVDPDTRVVRPQAASTPARAFIGILERAGTDDADIIRIGREVRERLLTGLYGTPVLFSRASTQSSAVLTTSNQPGSFLFRNGGETLLIEAAAVSGVRFEPLDSSLYQAQALTAVTPLSFVTRNISPAQSRAFFAALAESPAPASLSAADTRITALSKYGQVYPVALQNLTINQVADALHTDTGRAQQVLDVLRAGYGPVSLSYAAYRFDPDDSIHSLTFDVTRLSTGAIPGLEAALYAGGIDSLLALPRQQAPVTIKQPFTALGPATGPVPGTGRPLLNPPAARYGEQVDFDGPYGVYYWELFFHAPMLIARILHDNQQFQAAQKWLRYIFDPTTAPGPLTEERFARLLPADIDPARAPKIYAALARWIADGQVLAAALTADPATVAAAAGVTPLQGEELRNLLVNQYLAKPTGRYWQFSPFRNRTLESLKSQLQNCAEIAAYQDDPFDPDAIARLRAGAHEKEVVIAYIENLLDWGDQEFAAYTWESLTTARMLYSYAHDLLGPRPEDLGPCSARFPVTFGEILARYTDPRKIPPFLIDMENALAGGQAAGPVLLAQGTPFNDLGGVFCVPENTRLTGLWDRVDDRLYKIQHCLNLAGQAEPLALFQPPVNPADLVRAAASASGLPDLAGRAAPPVPSYRFSVLIERAEQVTEAVRSFGAALLSALERHDGEYLALVRAAQETGIMTMTVSVRDRAVAELQDEIAALEQGLDSAQYRAAYYANLIASGLNPAEITSLALTGASLWTRAAAIPIHGLSVAGYLLPTIYGLADGGMKFGDAIGAGAAITGVASELLSQSAAIADIVGRNQRRAEEWQLQRQTAQYEAEQLRRQLDAARERLAAACQEQVVTHQQVTDAAKVENILRTRFTSQDLYAWMSARAAAVYLQSFRLAQDLALAAQTAYQFELDRDNQVIAFDTWDSLHQGLAAGDGLALSLAQLRKAYLDNDTRRLEIEKTVSLRQAFPLAFAGFRWGHTAGAPDAQPGTLDFTLSESMFDFDYPGHYDRKIKSVSVSIPSVLGPYQDFHLTLTQNSNLVVTAPDATATDYAISRTAPDGAGRTAAPPPGSVRENWTPSQRIAVSRGVDDSGLFSLDFHDERYLPFEGTGAVSSWTLSMPPQTNRIDYGDIADIILKVRYTARDGGGALRSQVMRLYSGTEERYSYLNAASFDLSGSFNAQWRALFSPPGADGIQTVTFPVRHGAILPGLGAVKLRGVLVALEVAGGVAVSDGVQPFLTVQAGGTPADPVKIPVANSYGEVPASLVCQLPSQVAGLDWTLRFDTKKAPPALLADGALDPAKLLNVTVVLVYSAAVFGSR
ncbi:MAG TPA: neuraminidase-like domain-containing protein [Trebonia sp.]